MIVTYAFIQHVKPVMTYTDDARIASSNITHHHSPQVWEQLVGSLGTLINPRHMRGTIQNEKVNNLDLKNSRQHVTLSPRLSSMTS